MSGFFIIFVYYLIYMYNKLLVIIVLSCLLLSCRVTKVEQEKPIPVTVTTTRDVYKYLYDSIYVHDSIYLKDKGDTVFLYKWKTKYIEKRVCDTIIINDSIEVPVYIHTTEEKITNHLNLFQKIMMYLGLIFSGILIAYVLKRKFL